ncbi:hypothetical protein PAMP_004241 [Pampus punctatissimus]
MTRHSHLPLFSESRKAFKVVLESPELQGDRSSVCRAAERRLVISKQEDSLLREDVAAIISVT